MTVVDAPVGLQQVNFCRNTLGKTPEGAPYFAKGPRKWYFSDNDVGIVLNRNAYDTCFSMSNERSAIAELCYVFFFASCDRMNRGCPPYLNSRMSIVSRSCAK